MRALMLAGLLGLAPSPSLPPPLSHEWCALYAMTDAELIDCAALHPELYPTEEEWLEEQGCRFEEEGEEPEDTDSIYCEEEEP